MNDKSGASHGRLNTNALEWPSQCWCGGHVVPAWCAAPVMCDGEVTCTSVSDYVVQVWYCKHHCIPYKENVYRIEFNLVTFGYYNLITEQFVEWLVILDKYHLDKNV